MPTTAPGRSAATEFGADDPVTHVGTLQDRGDRDSLGADRLDVLHRMDAAIHLAVEQRAVELLGPQRLAADLGERTILDSVAGGADRDDLDCGGRPAVRGEQRVTDEMRLDEREWGTPSTEAEGRHGGLC